MPDVSVALSTIAAGVLLRGMLGLTALGLSIGVIRLVNLADGEFLLVGAYFGLLFVQATGVDPLLALPVIALAVVALAVVALAVPLYRLLLQPMSSASRFRSPPSSQCTGWSRARASAAICARARRTRKQPRRSGSTSAGCRC